MAADSLRIRPAQLEDVAALTQIVNWAYRGMPDATARGWTSEAELVGGPRITEDGMRELISSCDPASKLLLAAVEADDDRAVLGSLLLEKRGDECHLGLLSVDPRLQNRGIGRKLLAAGQQHGKDVFGCSYAGMKVVESRTELIQWYQRQGFELTDEREDFNYSLAVLLQGPLTFVGMRRPL